MLNTAQQGIEHLKHGVDVVSGVAIVAALMDWLPPVAAFLGIIWYLLQIYGWFEKRMNKKKNYARRVSDKGSSNARTYI